MSLCSSNYIFDIRSSFDFTKKNVKNSQKSKASFSFISRFQSLLWKSVYIFQESWTSLLSRHSSIISNLSSISMSVPQWKKSFKCSRAAARTKLWLKSIPYLTFLNYFSVQYETPAGFCILFNTIIEVYLTYDKLYIFKIQ